MAWGGVKQSVLFSTKKWAKAVFPETAWQTGATSVAICSCSWVQAVTAGDASER